MQQSIWASSVLNILTIIFAILRATGVIAWSWIWVFFPSLIYFSIFAIALIVLYIGCIGAVVDEIRFKKDIGLIGKNKGDKGQ